ncbi:ABC transporter permease [bacterium]|nr:ABC transporter permease [bacterium]
MLLKEFIEDIRKQKLRAFLTTIAITWGTLAVILLMAFGTGLGFQMRESLLNAGDKIIRIYGGQTTIKFQGLPVGRRIRLREDDARILRESIPMIEAVSANLGRRVRLRRADKSASTHMEGVYPEFESLRRMYPKAGGRFLNFKDLEERRRVVFLGSVVAEELFDSEDPVAKTITIDGLPFKVIGVLPKKTQSSMNNGPDDRRAIIPFSTFQSIYGDIYLNELIVKPSQPQKAKLVISKLRRILGRRYHFDPEDERAIAIWDFIEQEEIGAKVFMGLNIFLGLVGAMSLLIAGVGVANIMYVVVKERTHEIGIKRAVGAKRKHIIFQIVFESLLIAFTGGGLGLLISKAVVKLMWSIPTSDGAMQFLGRPIMDNVVIAIAVGILTVIGLLAGLFPARKAAAIDPVDALRYE